MNSKLGNNYLNNLYKFYIFTFHRYKISKEKRIFWKIVAEEIKMDYFLEIFF